MELVHKIRAEGLERSKDGHLPKEFLAFHPRVEEKRFFDVQNARDNGVALAIVMLLEKHPNYIEEYRYQHAQYEKGRI